MKQLTSYHLIVLAVALMTVLTGCEIAGDIFQAGLWVGIVVVLLVVFLIFKLLR